VVLGTVGSREVTAAGFYGVYAPRSGPVAVSQPEGAGLNYIAPMCVPTLLSVKSFADPQSYQLWDEKAYTASPVFRNTLKKMQGRWTGHLPGIDGTAAAEGKGRNAALKGELVNNSGYELKDVEIIVHVPVVGSKDGTSVGGGQGNSLMFSVGTWPKGASLALDKLKLEMVGSTSNPAYLENVLGALARNHAERGMMGGIGGDGSLPNDSDLLKGRSVDLLYLLLDARAAEPLTDTTRVEPVRTLARTFDCTKALYAAGGLIVARAGDMTKKEPVTSPVPITVNGRDEKGSGSVLFAWALPMSGTVEAAPLLEPGEKVGEKPAEAGPAGVQGRPGRPVRRVLPR